MQVGEPRMAKMAKEKKIQFLQLQWKHFLPWFSPSISRSSDISSASSTYEEKKIKPLKTKKGVRTNRRKSPKVQKVENLFYGKSYTI